MAWLQDRAECWLQKPCAQGRVHVSATTIYMTTARTVFSSPRCTEGSVKS